MQDPVNLKIKRADKHIGELNAVIQAFKEDHPYIVGSKRDSETGEYLSYLVFADPIPADLPLIVGDVIQNLYSALDYLAWQLVLAAGKKPSVSTAFPISEDAPTTANQIARYQRQVNGMRDEAKQIIRGMNPYRRMNNNLWRLHKLNNFNKHRNLLAVHANSRGASGWGNSLDGMILSPAPLEKGCVFARFPANTKGHEDVLFTFDIALNEIEADTSMWPLMAALGVFRNTVSGTVAALDSYR